MKKQYKPLRLRDKVTSIPTNVHQEIVDGAKKHNLSNYEFLGMLLEAYNGAGIKRDINKHIGLLDNLMTQYIDESYHNIFTFLRVIFLNSDKLPKDGRTAFLKTLENQLEEAYESMPSYHDNQLGV